MEKVRPWCGQPSDRGRLKNRTELEATSKGKERRGIGTEWEGGRERDEEGKITCHTIFV